jgi:hypothetical protein
MTTQEIAAHIDLPRLCILEVNLCFRLMVLWNSLPKRTCRACVFIWKQMGPWGYCRSCRESITTD